MLERKKAKKFLELIVKDEKLQDLVKNGKRIINKKKVEAFEEILNTILSDAEKNGFSVKYAIADENNPLSGFISVIGTDINFTMLNDVQEYIDQISYITVENYSEEETAVMIGFYNVVDLVKE